MSSSNDNKWEIHLKLASECSFQLQTEGSQLLRMRWHWSSSQPKQNYGARQNLALVRVIDSSINLCSLAGKLNQKCQHYIRSK